MDTTKRNIHYFELAPVYNNGVSDFTSVFDRIHELSIHKDSNRFVPNNDKVLYITGIETGDSFVQGKILDIRTDAFPQLMDMNDDQIRDIDTKETEGIVEATHFVIATNMREPLLALEYNHYGPRPRDFVYCLHYLGRKAELLNGLDFLACTRDDLESYQNSLGSISCVTAKVYRDNMDKLNNFDSGLYSAFSTVERLGESEYITLELSYDRRSESEISEGKRTIMAAINKFFQNRETASGVFDRFKVRARDNMTGKLKDFDLLNTWIRTELPSVQKYERSRVIVSSDILYQMHDAIRREFRLQ